MKKIVSLILLVVLAVAGSACRTTLQMEPICPTCQVRHPAPPSQCTKKKDPDCDDKKAKSPSQKKDKGAPAAPKPDPSSDDLVSQHAIEAVAGETSNLDKRVRGLSDRVTALENSASSPAPSHPVVAPPAPCPQPFADIIKLALHAYEDGKKNTAWALLRQARRDYAGDDQSFFEQLGRQTNPAFLQFAYQAVTPNP